MIPKKLARTAMIMDALLIFSVLLHSGIMFFLNTFYNPESISSMSREVIDIRLNWRQWAEGIVSVCSGAYAIGCVVLFCLTAREHVVIQIRLITLRLVIQIISVSVCAIPFALLDMAYWGDYIFPAWTSGGLFVLSYGPWLLLALRLAYE